MSKVLVCTRMPHDNSYVGGVVSIILSYKRHEDIFLDRGYELEVYSYEPSRRISSLPSKVSNILYALFQKKEILKKLKNDKVDIVHIHTSREFLFLKDVFLTKAISKKTGIPVALTIHVGDIGTVYNRINKARRMTIQYLNKYAKAVFFLSREIKDQFVNQGVNNKISHVLYNFYDFDTEIDNINACENNGITELLFVGAIHREKGILELLNSLIGLSGNYHLSICGVITDKSIEETFWQLVSQLGTKVDVLGYVTGEAKVEAFRRTDIFILPSYHEGMPLVILEALGSGCAIISTKVGTTKEILDDDNALWVDVGSSESLRMAIQRLVNNSSELQKMKKANYALSKQFCVDEHIENLCSEYDLLITNS